MKVGYTVYVSIETLLRDSGEVRKGPPPKKKEDHPGGKEK